MTAIFNPTGLATVPPVPRPAPPAPDPAPAAPEPVVPTAVGPVGPVLELPGTPGAALVPVTCSGRPVGAFVLVDGRVRYRRVVDPDQLVAAATGAFAVAALTAAVALWSRRRPPAVGTVTMGPGGWLSLRGASIPRPRPDDRPWWARLLRAHPLPR
ncbi:hypothetical protein GA0070622_4399 [Micromonospora sediminicola]|uniref:Uncharacterized protein n=1 Tax=Micromonospora sediminicola TaxID=946078 RepID=A0A1A9BDU4_9ACTN|nr:MULTISPECIES: hypothetical protein [Micromonospora]PGH45438.1 hypothetical protein COO58_14200 [Micromonospora sp. WMMA1996]SBT67338.1 hypothetical protein GA0070622_4399 [Micromonospora sediminicola]